jgi:hypothetical protein
MKTLL